MCTRHYSCQVPTARRPISNKAVGFWLSIVSECVVSQRRLQLPAADRCAIHMLIIMRAIIIWKQVYMPHAHVAAPRPLPSNPMSSAAGAILSFCGRVWMRGALVHSTSAYAVARPLEFSRSLFISIAISSSLRRL